MSDFCLNIKKRQVRCFYLRRPKYLRQNIVATLNNYMNYDIYKKGILLKSGTSSSGIRTSLSETERIVERERVDQIRERPYTIEERIIKERSIPDSKDAKQ